MAHYSGDTPFGHVEFDHTNPNLSQQDFLNIAKSQYDTQPGIVQKVGTAISSALENPAIKPAVTALTMPGRITEALGAGLGAGVGPMVNAIRSGERQQLPSLSQIGDVITNQYHGTPSPLPGASIGAKIGSFADPVALGLSEVGGEAIKPLFGRMAVKALPSILEHEAGIPASATLEKLAKGNLPKVEPSISKQMYMNEVGKVIDRPTQDALIDQLANSSKPAPRGMRRSVDIGDINMANVPKTSELGTMIASSGIETPILSKQDLSEGAKKLRNLQQLIADPELRTSVGDRKILTEAYNLRRNLDYSINWKPAMGSKEDAFKQANQNLLKTMRHQADDLIGQLPGGNVIKTADAGAKERIAGGEFNKLFNRPSAYRLAGMGAAPFVVSRLANAAGMGVASYPLAIAATLASQSPKAIGAMMDMAPQMLKPSILTALQQFRKLASPNKGQE